MFDIEEYNSIKKDSIECENFSHMYILVENLPNDPDF